MKLRALRPVVEMAVRNRFPLPVVVIALTLLGRAMHSGTAQWQGSEMQSAFAAVIYGALLPVLVIAVGSSWLRGDDTPWSWAFARPVTRTRWLNATLVVDLLTVAICVALTQWIIGSAPHVWIGGWFGEVERMVGYAAVLVLVYCGAAFAGARGASAIGAAFHVAVLAAATVCAEGASSSVYSEMLGSAFTRHLLLELPSVPTLTIIAAIAVLATRRAALALPVRPRLRDITGLVALAVALAITFPWALSTVALWLFA